MVDEKPTADGLAKKLDKELDEHIETLLEKNKDYKYKGLTEENFEEVFCLFSYFRYVQIS